MLYAYAAPYVEKTRSTTIKFCVRARAYVWQFCTLITIRAYGIGFTSVMAIDHNQINWLNQFVRV